MLLIFEYKVFYTEKNVSSTGYIIQKGNSSYNYQYIIHFTQKITKLSTSI